MSKKLTEFEIQDLLEGAMSFSFPQLLDYYLEDPNLKGKIEEALSGTLDEEESEKIIELVTLDIAKQFDEPIDLQVLVGNIFDYRIKVGFCKSILRHMDEMDFTLSQDRIIDFALMTEDVDFLRECLDRADEYHLDYYGKSALDTEIYLLENPVLDFDDEEPTEEELALLEKEIDGGLFFDDDWDLDEDSKESSMSEESGEKPSPEEKLKKQAALIWESASGNFSRTERPGKVFYEDPLRGPLDYTEEEKFAIEVYEGVVPGGGHLGHDPEAYRTINAMMFPGIDNEMERIFDNGSKLNADAIYQAEELLERSVALYSVMYKYGQRMPGDKVGYRVDRASAAKLATEEGKTISNFSTSITGYKRFSKADIALEKIHIKQGTPCADFKEILGSDGYYLSDEAEVLVAPMCPIEVLEERDPISQEELKIRNTRGGHASRVYEMRTVVPEKAEPLTEEEQRDYDEQRRIFESEEYRDAAATFISKLDYLRRDGFKKEEASIIIDQEDLKRYLEWKSAFQAVYRYRVRERMLEIDREVEEATREGRPLYSGAKPSRDHDGTESLSMDIHEGDKDINEIIDDDTEELDEYEKTIDISEIDALAKSRTLKGQEAVKDIQGFLQGIVHKQDDKVAGNNSKGLGDDPKDGDR